jgi:predicted RNA-binding Zn ribbon-like protein
MVRRRAPVGSSRLRAGWPYPLRGGALCLEFVNTVGWWRRPEAEDRLVDYEALLAWGVRTGALGTDEARRLLGVAARRPAAAAREVRAARRLRDAIHAVFTASAERRPAPRRELGVLNEALARVHRHLRLEPRGRGLAWRWDEGDTLERVLWPVARSAARLLTSPDLGRVHECGDPRCGWLFLDTSRNGSRRWCSMSDCGNRAKARRHYRRHRAN